jgi:uncharacterized protein YkwD
MWTKTRTGFDRHSLRTVCSALLAGLALQACGADDGASDGARSKLRLGKASLATNDRPEQVDPASADRRGGVVRGEPSLDELEELAPPVAVGSPDAGCVGGELGPTAENIDQIARATLCLVNAERRARGLRRLRSNRRLDRAALAHVRDMVSRGFFAHDSPSGATVGDRIRRTGYLAGSVAWTVGENLAWGSGSRATARQIVDAWMGSPGHRANILNRSFNEVGVGIVIGAPLARGMPAAATYNTDFGFRRRAT